jgi:hypothetical protein
LAPIDTQLAGSDLITAYLSHTRRTDDHGRLRARSGEREAAARVTHQLLDDGHGCELEQCSRTCKRGECVHAVSTGGLARIARVRRSMRGRTKSSKFRMRPV